MKTENKYVGIYHQAVKCGLIRLNETNTGSILELSHNNIIPLTRVNQFFFGTNSFTSKFNYLNLFRESIIKKHLGIYWVYTSKLEKYLEEVFQIINLENNFSFCPYNYYKTFKSNIPVHYQQMNNSIDKFISYLDSDDKPEARTIRNIWMPNSKKGQLSKLETEVVDFLEIGETKNMILKFSKKGSPLFIQLIYSENPISNTNNKSDNYGTLRIGQSIEDDECEKLYEYICQRMLMDTPKEFLINNLERVCGLREFAEIMVKSYLNREQFTYPINEIKSIVLWKSESNAEDYKLYFIGHYPHCFDKCSSCLNFEGINKFLLNINEDDVENFDVKEQINEMYYNSMTELIHSFELLYKNKA